MTTRLTLSEIADRVAPDERKAYQTAIDVIDGRAKPPPESIASMEAIAKRYVDVETAKFLHDFDTSDHAVAARYLNIRTDWDLDAWKKAAPDRSQKLADIRRQRRGEYEGEVRAQIRENISGEKYAVRQLARACLKVIEQAVRAAITAPSVVVSATADVGSPPRNLRRVDVLKAAIDIRRETLTIGGNVFRDVEIEIPAEAGAGQQTVHHDVCGLEPEKARTGNDTGQGSASQNSADTACLADDPALDPPPPIRRGPLPFWPWEEAKSAFAAFLGRSPDGLPAVQAVAERWIANWFSMRQPDGRHPDEREIRRRIVTPIYEAAREENSPLNSPPIPPTKRKT